MKVTALFVGSSLLAPLREAEGSINKQFRIGLKIATHNCTLPIVPADWPVVEADIADSDIVFVVHVTDSENALRIKDALRKYGVPHHAVIVINCMGDLMRLTRLGTFEPFSIFREASRNASSSAAAGMLRKLGAWMSAHGQKGRAHRPEKYLTLVGQLPPLLRLVPSSGRLGHIKHYLTLFCYFLQPTPANIRSMILYAIKYYVPGQSSRITVEKPETRPVTGIYHPDAPSVWGSLKAYRKWYEQRETSPGGGRWRLDPNRTIGLLLMRPQVVSGARAHYDTLIRAIEGAGLPVIPVISTLMDSRDACNEFLVDSANGSPQVSQILSLTGFSFVGGPASNDSKAAVDYLGKLNRPLRSTVSLETQRTDEWAASMIGLNPVQTVMQIAIPEIDGATEPFVFGGIPGGANQPAALEDRCRRIARRLKRWDGLRTESRAKLRLAVLIYCFPPGKGNLGTAADLDVFPSLQGLLSRLREEGYSLPLAESADDLRERMLAGDHIANVYDRLPADVYRRLCPYINEIEAEWGEAPGTINAQGQDILIHGIALGNVFVGVQPTFGYEGDPMRLLMAQGGAPHHGFMGLYTWLDRVFQADALLHVGTHGALEFMPGKQAGLSERCWPDRLIGDFPNIYVYSVNNPSEGSIAKRRSYAELISYLTPPIQSSGLYKELAGLKELVSAYRQARDEGQREHLFVAIEEKARELNMDRLKSSEIN
jgi:magnesium chelatase subunit H